MADIDGGTHDPRAVANLVLDLLIKPTTNLALQKILYFVHGAYLTKNNTPLMSGYFEAWTHGPVHPTVYQSFKSYKGEPIKGRASKKDLRTGTTSIVESVSDEDVVDICKTVLATLSGMSAGQLVALSHAKDGAWDRVYVRSKNERMLGLRISNQLIKDNFKHHLILANPPELNDDPSEEAPLTYNGFG